MAKLVNMFPGKELDNPEEDFRTAVRVEQYRVSDKALYIPEGFRWKVLPFAAVDKAENSFRVISAGHCVPVREKRPEIDLLTAAGTIHISLEKPESMQKILDLLQTGEGRK